MTYRTLAIAIAAVALASASAQATTVNFDATSINGDSLHGSTGSLTASLTATPGVYEVTWSLNSSTFVGDATHNVVQSLAFKAFTSISAVSVAPTDSGPAGTLYWPSNVNGNGGANCVTSSEAGFVCFDFVPDVATGGTISKTFLVTGTLNEGLDWSFRGKYGTGTGWVISASAPPVPEPTSAAVFGLGALMVGAALRRRMRA